jgi:probable rRNA maturation factor
MVRIAVVNAHPRRGIRGEFVKRSVRVVLQGERKPGATISVVFIDGRRCRELNRKYLHHDYATDVISFPLEEGENLEGEIYVNLDRAREQARRYKVTFRNEVARLIVHGTLHLVGYDDLRPRDAQRMKHREESYVNSTFPVKRKTVET